MGTKAVGEVVQRTSDPGVPVSEQDTNQVVGFIFASVIGRFRVALAVVSFGNTQSSSMTLETYLLQ